MVVERREAGGFVVTDCLDIVCPCPFAGYVLLGWFVFIADRLPVTRIDYLVSWGCVVPTELVSPLESCGHECCTFHGLVQDLWLLTCWTPKASIWGWKDAKVLSKPLLDRGEGSTCGQEG